MRVFLIIFLVFSYSSCTLTSDNHNRSIELSERYNGITLGLHSKDFNYDYSPMIQEIKSLGSDWISFQIKYFQQDIYATSIESSSENLKQLTEIIRYSKSQGLKVFVLPILLLKDDKEGEHWRGLIAPQDKKAWHRNYLKQMKDLASLLESEEVELFSVGSEFNSRQEDTEEWIQLISEIRSVYSGKIIYSANWDAIETVDFKEHLNYMGISAYFSLSHENDPALSTLKEGWELSKNYVLKEALRNSPPIIITELGYASLDGINKDPWNYLISNSVDLEEQKACFEAFLEVWKDETRLAGVFFYDWFGIGGKEDGGYTFKDKPAQKVIATYLNQHKE